ncbi:MAG: FadR family transcriptional regulator [Rhodospirillales bacterium]|nr:FadR family transcriptional regulator [Rhodospirillales bacterium]
MSGIVTFGERLYEKLLGSIFSGAYPEGTRLPTEMELCTLFSVSRPVVREALARLRAEGYIESRRGSGSYVLQRSLSKTGRIGGVGSIAEIEECYDFRESLEGEASFLAAQRRTEGDLDILRERFEAIRVAFETPTGGILEDLKFHHAIAEATHNQFFVYSFEAVEQHILFSIEFTRRLTASPFEQRKGKLIAEHEAILDGIAKGDGKGARAAMQAHIGNSKRRIFTGEPK